MKKDVLTIGFARRATAYKRHNFIFSNLERLKNINKKYPLQIIFAGKAHPRDENGKKIIEEVFRNIKELKKKIKIVYLANSDIEMAKKLTSGCDVWLNTPQRPMEASGTSGMKAAHNGVINFSILDGWWLEGFVEGVTGWSIGPGPGEKIKPDESYRRELADLYNKLEYTVLPMYYNQRDEWMNMMENSIGKIAYYFNTHRMMRRYVLYAYL
jgi:starch phosphorylase